MASIDSDSKHVLLLPLPAWGHVRPMLVLATRLVLERQNVVVTVLLSPTVLENAVSDITAQFEGSGPALKNARPRIRIVVTFKTKESDMFKVMQMFSASYPAAYETLLNRKPLVCASTGKAFNAVPPPVVIIMDFFAVDQLRATRGLSGHAVPIIAWITSTPAFIIRLCGSEELGGIGDIGAEIDAEVLRTGRPEIEVGEEIYFRTSGTVINVAGVPPMYDYEFFPQNLPFNIPFAPFTRQGYSFLKESDGLLISTFEKFENKGTLKVFKSWLSSWGKDAYGIGPLLPLGYGHGNLSSRGEAVVEAFLDSALQKYGAKSVLNISFGSMIWPTDPEYIDEVVDALIEKEFPFILCCASPLAKVTDDLAKKIKTSGLGLLTKWAPQQYILNHRAVGWFLTHCGYGGVTEALGSGVPMISWPFSSDQPTISAQLSANHSVLIELIEVRNSVNGRKPIFRLDSRIPVGTREAVGVEIREVINKLRGDKGKDMALNAERLKKDFSEAWEEGGDARTELNSFLKKYVDDVRHPKTSK